jgi:hypothetical protein
MRPLDPFSLGFALVRIHRVVVLLQQPLDPASVQVDSTATRLFFQRLTQGFVQTLEALAAQALVDIGHALQHALGEQTAAILFAMQRHELGAQVGHIVAQNTFHAVFEAVFQPHHRVLLHALVQRQGHRATADDAAFIFQHELFDATGALFQHIDRQRVLEVDLRRLRGGALAEAGATVVGVPFEVEHVVQLVQHVGLAGAGQAAHQHEIALFDRRLGGLQQEGAQGLVAALDARVVDAGLIAQPLLDDQRAQAATEAIQVTVGVRLGEAGPGMQSLALDGAADQLVAEGDGGSLALLLVAGTDLLPLLVGHQRQVDGAGEGAFDKLDGRAHVHHRRVIEEQLAKVGAVGAHQFTSTA